MPLPPEPAIDIGPHRLSTPEAMTVRVAHMGHRVGKVQTPEQARKCYETVLEFKSRIEAEGLGEDETGKAIASGYVHHAGTVLRLIEAQFGPFGES